ncbi:MAG: gamma-glutamylcyclotransferase family protein [Actinomycetota bacterium]
MREPNTKLRHLFVYGTLLPGDVRWHRLAPLVVNAGIADHVDGRLFDTGLAYPAAVFDDASASTIVGRTYELDDVDLALAILDEIEGTVAGLYHRVQIDTARGHRAWSYQYGGDLELTPIQSGDWTAHRQR